MAIIYTRIKNQHKSKNLILFSAGFYKINEEDQRSDKIKIFNTLNIYQNLTESGKINIDVNLSIRKSNSDSRNKKFRLDI